MQMLILAAGRGKRLNHLTEFQNKCMIRLRGKPVLEYHLEQAVRLGMHEIVITIGYLGETIRAHFGSRYGNVPIRYVLQEEQQGLVHAMEVAAPTITGPFMLTLGDEYFLNPDHQGLIDCFSTNDLFGVCGVVEGEPPESIRKTYSVLLGADRRIHRLVEKPRRPVNSIKGTGTCVFRREIFDYIRYTPIHYLRREKELPGLIQEAVDDGEAIACHPLSEGYFNINQVEDLESFLDRYDHDTTGKRRHSFL